MRLFLVGELLGLLLLAGCATGSTSTAASAPAQAPLNQWAPQLAVVFAQLPPGQNDVARSFAVNVSVWPTNRVLCDKPPSPKVSLYVAKRDEPGDFTSKEPSITRHQVGNVSFPSAEFNDVPASLAADPGAAFSFVAYVRGQPASNVWLHGAAATSGYAPLKPTGYASPDPAALDTRIQVVFPHDDHGRPVSAATAAELNIAVDIFQHGTTLSVPPDTSDKLQLWWAQGNAALAILPQGPQKTTYTLNGQGCPRWVFNDVAVQPGQTYHFLATVGLLGQHGGSYPSIWTHGAPAHLAAPKPQPPPACIP